MKVGQGRHQQGERMALVMSPLGAVPDLSEVGDAG
jgi:hypothetical protein